MIKQEDEKIKEKINLSTKVIIICVIVLITVATIVVLSIIRLKG